jgi:AraC-like DNA-binding protein
MVDLRLILLNVGFSELNGNWNWRNIRSPFARIYFVTNGKAHTYFNKNMYVLNPGNLYLIPPLTSHNDECTGLFSHYYIHFYEKTDNKESIFEKFDFPVEIVADSLDILLIERLLKINPDRHLKDTDPKMYDNAASFFKYIADNNKIPTYFMLEIHSILCRLVSRFMKGAKQKSRYGDIRINKCLQYIHENLDKNITVSQLANISCVTGDYFCRIFKKQTNYTPIKYINLKKIEKAQLLLLTTNMPIIDVAMKLSIDNFSYFNRLFRKYTNISPGKYRKFITQSL